MYRTLHLALYFIRLITIYVTLQPTYVTETYIQGDSFHPVVYRSADEMLIWIWDLRQLSHE